MRLFGLDIQRAERQSLAPAQSAIGKPRPSQSVRSYDDPLHSNQYIKHDVDLALYEVIVRAMPFLDRGLRTLSRMVMPFEITCDNEATKAALEDWCDNVTVNGVFRGIWPFLRSHVREMLQFGKAGGEVVLDAGARDVARLYNIRATKLQLIPDGDNILFGETVNGTAQPYPDQSLIVYSAANNKGDEPHGQSILRSIPFLVDIVLRMENAVRQKWQRHGAPSFLVHYKIDPAVSISDTTVSAAKAEIEADWQSGQRNRWNQEGILDFIAVTQGDFVIQAITDGYELNFDVPYRALTEQIVSSVELAPFMLGLQWSTTERLSQQQADCIIGSVDDYRRELKPDVLYVLDWVQRCRGLRGTVGIEWSDVNLQDAVETARAELAKAQAQSAQIKNATDAWRNGWIDQLQAADMAGVEIDDVAVAIDMPPGGGGGGGFGGGDEDEGGEEPGKGGTPPPAPPDDQTAEQEAEQAVSIARAKALWQRYPR
jgi:hypothetical protein